MGLPVLGRRMMSDGRDVRCELDGLAGAGGVGLDGRYGCGRRVEQALPPLYVCSVCVNVPLFLHHG